MADKKRKSQAELAAEKTKNKKKALSKKYVRKSKPTGQSKKDEAREVPIRLISSVVCLAMFVLFVVAFFSRMAF